jgi:hypothetical protein
LPNICYEALDSIVNIEEKKKQKKEKKKKQQGTSQHQRGKQWFMFESAEKFGVRGVVCNNKAGILLRRGSKSSPGRLGSGTIFDSNKAQSRANF